MSGELGLGIDHLSDVQLIGSGGFSVVYAATHRLFDRRVAVKVLTTVKGESDKRRFERECRVMGRLSDVPNVVTVFHADYTERGEPYLIMELVEGGTLGDRLSTAGPFGWQEAVDLTIPVCAALGHAHEEGILHRDIKPENILLDDGVPKLTDFGIAYLRDSTGKSSTHVSASWLHAPPETFNNERDEQSDLYSLGSTLQTLIVGHPPFWQESDESLHPLMNRLLNEPAPQVPPQVAPAALASFLSRTLAKDRTRRPRSAAEFAAELAEIRGVAPPVAAETVVTRSPQLGDYPGGLLAASEATQTNPSIVGDAAPSSLTAAAPPASPPTVTAGQQTVFTPAASGAGIASTQASAAGQPVRRSPLLLDAAAPNVPNIATGHGPSTGDLPPVSERRLIPLSRPPRRNRMAAVVLLLALLGAVGGFLWWSNDDDGPQRGEAVASADATETATEGESDEGSGDAAAGAGGTGDETSDENENVDPGDDGGADAGGGAVKPTVPKVTGLTEANAIDTLEEVGITASIKSRVSSGTVAEGRVISQDPGSGTRATVVGLTVSTGPAPVIVPTVPDVEGMTQADATKTLEDENISVTIGAPDSSGTVPAGNVIHQDPAAGTKSDSVTLVISTGGTVIFDKVTFSPGSPHVFKVGDKLSISIDYTSTYDSNVQIWARPTSGDYGASGSAEIAPGSGNHPQSFTLNSPGTVDQIRVYAADVATSEVVAERFVDVSFTWEEEVGPPATPGQLTPANGSVFDHFPRATTLTWSAVPGAVSYSVETQFLGGPTWSSGVSGSEIGGTSFSFNFVGAQPGRWRVWAVDGDGRASAKSPWWTFEYTI